MRGGRQVQGMGSRVAVYSDMFEGLMKIAQGQSLTGLFTGVTLRTLHVRPLPLISSLKIDNMIYPGVRQ